MGRGAAGEELAGAHAAGEGLEECGFMRRDRGTSTRKQKPNKKV